MKKRLCSLRTVLTLLQAVTVVISLMGVYLAAILLYVGIQALGAGYPAIGMPLGSYVTLLTVGFLSVLAVSGACAVALCTFFRMCGRLKQDTAFTRANEQAMGRIALCCLIAGLTLAVGCAALWVAESVWGCVMGLYWLEMVIMAVLFLAVALIAWALTLLVRRAVALQEEADLTV
ncbi:MAG: DUF2975 domain-containing protein [Aristaeellaceae bacterium]